MEWRTVEEFPAYQVSDDGRVRRNGKEIAQYLNDKGYPKVSLSEKGKTKHRFVHILVAKAFIPNVNNKPQVNHKDLNRENAHDWNLEWVTQSENMKHSARNNESSRKKLRPVVQYTLEDVFIAEYESIVDAQLAVNGSYTGIRGCADGNYKQSYGYLWRWKNVD